MKLLRSKLFITIILCTLKIQAQSITYISPVPNSQFNSRETNIILRSAERILEHTVSASDICVTGSVSGIHFGTFTLSDDQQTLLFQPNGIFSPSEKISVLFNGEVRTEMGNILERKNFSFTVTTQSEPLTRKYSVNEQSEVVLKNTLAKISEPTDQTISSIDSLPADFPKFKVDTVTHPAPGNYFLTTSDDVPGVGHFLYMIDNTGKVVKYLRRPGHVYDFKVQPNGLFSYADPYSDWGYAGGSRCVHRIMDSTFAVVDSFRAGNGYDADTHEFMMLPNGHVILHAYDIQYYDLSKVVTGGNANAIVVGSIVQELDLQKNVVFQWRSWDHVAITETYMNATAAAFDYIHVNAYDLDADGNLLLCFRNTCEIAKVNRMTGEFMWRMGGRYNEFTFIGENEANKANYYTFQHSFKRLPNGNFILFDNGNLHPQVLSRGVEYKIDQVNKTATLIWQYRHTPDVYAPTRGSVQRLANGNTVIGWGSASLVGVGKTMITELSPTGEVLFEMESLDKMPSYRALKFEWNAHLLPAGNVTIPEVLPAVDYTFNKGDTNRTNVTVKLTDATIGYNSITVKKYLYAPQKTEFPDRTPMLYPIRFVIDQTGISSFTADITFDSSLIQPAPWLNKLIVYQREFEGSGMFVPLTTVYEAVQRTLSVTTTKFGEFIIGIPFQATAPVAPTTVTPVQNALVNQTKPVPIRWSTSGHITGSHLQIAKDSNFTVMVFNDSTLTASYKLWSGYELNKRYYWRTAMINELGKSGWSSTGTFITSSVYISVLYPTANIKFVPNSSYQLKYENNFDERVNIRLYKNGALALKIKDSTENTGRFVWKVPATGLSVDSIYTIKISSVLDSNLYAVSPSFSISTTVGVVNTEIVIREFALLQNYPNPFNPTTTIRFSVPSVQQVSIKIYDLLGKEIAMLMNEQKQSGEYSVQFNGDHVPSGMYFCRMQAGNFVSVKKMLLMK
jgi:hypothetical protein